MVARPAAQQMDLFDVTPRGGYAGHPSEEVAPSWVAPSGPPEYRAAVEMLHFVDYLKLTPWQRDVLWPHLRVILESRMPAAATERQLYFELGYIVGTLEVEQLRPRSAARQIAEKYGVTF